MEAINQGAAMTPAQRETLADVLERAKSMDDDVPIWAYNYQRSSAVAAALRADLVERICGTCHHGERLRMMDGVERIWCHIHHSHRPGDDGCIRGWQAREGEGGEK